MNSFSLAKRSIYSFNMYHTDDDKIMEEINIILMYKKLANFQRKLKGLHFLLFFFIKGERIRGLTSSLFPFLFFVQKLIDIGQKVHYSIFIACANRRFNAYAPSAGRCKYRHKAIGSAAHNRIENKGARLPFLFLSFAEGVENHPLSSKSVFKSR